MADPFSILAGTAGLLDVSWRVASYLKDLHGAAAKVEDDIAALLHEIEALISVNEAIKDIFSADLQPRPDLDSASSTGLGKLWEGIGRILQDCRATIEKLEIVVKDIIGKEGPRVTGKVDGFRKQMRKQSKNEELAQFRLQLANYHGALQVLLTALNVNTLRRSQESTDLSLDQIAEKLQGLGFDLRSQIASLQPRIASGLNNDLSNAIKPAAVVASSVSSNKHFCVPHTVSSIFTGRKRLLQDLRHAFRSGSTEVQKRFVIWGLGGSGKTEFCCKFAQDNRASFWGVFSIDASSKESRKRGFDQIARTGGLEPNERAAKSWLSSLEDPWLLLIDGVDDPKTSIDKYFPDGERGHVLITTRNPTHKVHGTVGSRSYHFEILEKDDASDLLLKAACEPEPWSTTAKNSATRIAESLGFLPLALVHAGGTIKNGLCSLEDYIDFYTRSWQRIRRDRTSFGISQDDSDMNVYSSYEINYQNLEAISTETANPSTETAKDAIELLKTFSFLHCEDMRLDILIRAAINPDLEQQQRLKEVSAEKAKRVMQRRKPWARFVKEMALGILAGLIKDRGQAVLPAVLRSTGTGNSFDKDRLRRALNELTQNSLISHRLVSGRDSYSMHPLVHTWVRNRPRTSTAEQAVWCQAAATTLTQCILLPPLGLDESDEDFQRDLLPHVDHVLKCQIDVQLIIDEKRKSRRIPWPVATSGLDARKAIQMAKFSHVYSQCGDFDRAEKLQKPVKDFVCEMLGAEHPYAMAITLALAGTYWQQSRDNEAADLQEQVLQACIASLGVEDRKTLKVMDTLGLSRCFQGRFKEALALHEKAVEGLTTTAGENDEDTLLAINNLGQIHTRYFRFHKARELHEKALTGMQEIHGPTHLNTLSAMESLAMTYLGLGGDLLFLAQDLMSQVVEQRTKKLGKEQPYTLLAVCNLARIRSALGYMDEAASLMRAALPIAERNLGENHFGTLAGKVHLARVVVRQKRYEEAEQIFLDVIQRQRYEAAARNGEHPDRIMALWYLLQCYQEHGKIEDAMRLCREASEALSSIGGQGHPFAQKLLDKESELRSLGAAGNQFEVTPL